MGPGWWTGYGAGCNGGQDKAQISDTSDWWVEVMFIKKSKGQRAGETHLVPVELEVPERRQVGGWREAGM